MGDRDFAQIAIAQLSAQTIFHGLPIRPGKPLLGALTSRGQPILGLPGNPVSVLVTARRFASIILRRLAGLALFDPAAPTVTLANPVPDISPLWLYRPVRLTAPGQASLLPTQGSGDIVSAAQSDGFVEIAPSSSSASPNATLPYYPWTP